MASPHALLETQALKQLAQIVETDGRIGGAAEKQSQCLLSSHNDILRPNRKTDGHTQFRLSHQPSVLRSGYINGYTEDFAMSDTSHERALNNYRKRLKQRGMARLKVLGLDADRKLIRSLARRLADNGPDSARIRATVRRAISGEPPKKGGILDALRRSPLVGADLNLRRAVMAGRKVDL